MNNLWINTRSFVYTGVALIGGVLIFLGSVVILPVIIGVIVALIVFYMFKSYMAEKAEYERNNED